MGRKIPAKKHRGVKDPLKQQEQRLKSLKNKINAPPKDPDEQPVPRSLTRLFAFLEKNKKNDNKKKKIDKPSHVRDVENVASVDDNPIAHMHQLPGESKRGFSLRINSAIRALHDPLEQQDYPQDVEEDDVKGQRMADQRDRREKKRQKAARAASKVAGYKEPAVEKKPKLTRAQKLALKRKAFKMKSSQVKEERREVVYERVNFGEVAHAPPALQIKPRKCNKEEGAPRPGRRQLLLAGLLRAPPAPAPAPAPARAAHPAHPAHVARPAPARPAHAPAELVRRERARLAAVAAYRALKANTRNQR